jgi:hypothetical protein
MPFPEFCHPTLHNQFMSEEKKSNDLWVWLKRLGWLGFLFFLIKGLLWLVVFFFAGSEIMKSCN